MKRWLFTFLLTQVAWSRPVVLVSYYDAFDKAPFNNSERIARELERALRDQERFTLKLCPLQTVFDLSYAQLENCLKELSPAPLLVLGLGESSCDLKVEIVTRNIDKTKGADNAGNERNNTAIIPEGAQFLPLNYPLQEMYCTLGKSERSEIDISNNAGSFVCNNTAYQLTHYYPELTSGFIHVPANNCRSLERRNQASVKALSEMIKAAVEVLTRETHQRKSLPIFKSELEVLRKKADQGQDKCEQEFLKRVRGVDEKGFWPFSGRD